MAGGTLIYTPSGWTSVQSLSVGSKVYGFNPVSDAYVKANVTNISSQQSTNLIDINGRLNVTAVNQPLFVRNTTYLGFLKDPRNLTVGDQFFDPNSCSWVNVTALRVVTESTTVYDVHVDWWGDFILQLGSHSIGAAQKIPAGGED